MTDNINAYVFVSQLSHIKAVILSALESSEKSQKYKAYDRYIQTVNLLSAADYMLANLIDDYDKLADEAERSEEFTDLAPSDLAADQSRAERSLHE